MPTKNLVQQQREIIQRSYSLVNDYNQKKAEADARLSREKEAAQAVASVNPENSLAAIRQAVKSAQDAISKSKLLNKVGKGVSSFSMQNINGLDFAQQIAQCQTEAERASKRIPSIQAMEFERKESEKFRRFLIGLLAFGVGIVVIAAMANLFPGLNAVFLLIVPTLVAVLVFYFVDRLASYLPKIRGQVDPNYEIQNEYATVTQCLQIAENISNQWLIDAQQQSQRLLNESQTRYAITIKEIENRFANDVKSLQLAGLTLRKEAGILGIDWSDPTWKQWQPSQAINSVVRIGTLTTSLHKYLPSIPGFIAFPSSENLLIKTSGKGKAISTSTVQSLMLRLLTTQPPGKVRFTLIDPIGLGQSVANFMQLADYDERLVNSRVWTESRHIEQQLAVLSEHMEDVIQKYLRGQYTTIEEYNEQAGEVAEPYRILVVIGFPVNFSEDAARRLVKIASNGPRCGVSTIVMIDTEQPLPYGFNLSDLERVSTILEWDGQRTIWRDKDFEKCQLQLDTPPELNLFNDLLEKIGQDAKNTNQVQVPFDRVMPSRGDWWKGSTRNGLKVALGRAGAKKLQSLDLGKGTSQHALVVGKTGSGKTTLLHVLIANLALTYSPNELELYLVDFKTVGFTAYATYTLPHAHVIAIQSEREFGLSVLQGLDAELERRKNIYSKAGVQDIGQYRDTQPNAHMPRILLLVDEFQEFFTYDDKVASEAGLLLDRLVRQGRAFGIHVMLGSQTLAGSYSLARATIGQMAVRIALQCEESDSRLVLSDDNPAARLLSRPGEAIYNAANGLVEGNSPFQCSWLSDDELDTYLDVIRGFAEEKHYAPSWNQIIFDGSKDARIADNRALASVIKAPTWVIPQKYAQAWVGDPIAIKDPTTVQIRHQAGFNLLLLGQQEETALGMMIASLLSLAAQHGPGLARFYLVDFSPSDAANADLLRKAAEALPHQMKVVNRRGLLQVVTSIADEVQDRIEADGGNRQPIYFFIYGLQRARDLRPDEDFSFSSFGSDAPAAPNPAKQFSLILREGPEVSVHTLAWCDTLANLNRNLERGLLREFELRIAFQMSQEDSINFIDSPATNNLGPHRALFFSEETGRAEKFLPYGIPDPQWLHQATQDISRKRE